jgi:hypothetical protein
VSPIASLRASLPKRRVPLKGGFRAGAESESPKRAAAGDALVFRRSTGRVGEGAPGRRSGGDDGDGAAEPRCTAQAAVGGQQVAVEGVGESDVGGVAAGAKKRSLIESAVTATGRKRERVRGAHANIAGRSTCAVTRSAYVYEARTGRDSEVAAALRDRA